MSDDVVFALFEPSESHLLSNYPQAQLLVDNPLLASALSNIFPYLLFIDGFLEVITWTNDDHYFNFLVVVAYSVLVVYWSLLKYWILPLLSALLFSSVVWNSSSLLHDARHGERPTIDEVLSALHNITVRFELVLRPARHLDLSVGNYIRLAAFAAMLTPVHLVIIKFIVPPPAFAWLAGVFALTYHCPSAFATRRLLWRSAYLRKAMYHLTGLNIHLSRSIYGSPIVRASGNSSTTHSPNTTDSEYPTSDSVPVVNNYTVLKKVVVSSSQLKQIVRFDILENERRWLGLGWSKYLLPHERANYCYTKSMIPVPDPNTETEFQFPSYDNNLHSHSWQWIDEKWSVDLEYSKSKNKDGWIYCDKSWSDDKFEDGFSRYTRSRQWTRRAVLLIDKLVDLED